MKISLVFSVTFMLLLMTSICLANGESLYNIFNMAIGKIDNDRTVRNTNNQALGKIASDGTVRNVSNALLGRVDNGSVRNASNVSIGSTIATSKKDGQLCFISLTFLSEQCQGLLLN